MAANESTERPLEGLTGRPIGYDDATWILTSAFIVFTMQSGFGLIESGMVTIKNETNIMVKNAIDIIFSGLSFWIFGFGLSFGIDEGTNAFTGVGYFLTEVPMDKGQVYSMYFFQMALASTATTIVSGAMAERTNLKAYMLYSFVSTLTTCFPTHWIWGKNGLLKELGVIDIAGCAGVHLVGGAAGFAAAFMLGPRTGRFENDKKRPQPCSMTNVLLGTFMLWWGWLGFNCGSTFGISGSKWKLASRSAVSTLNGSIGGGILAIIYSYIIDDETLDVPIFVTGIRGGLVSVTGICALARPWEGLVIGFFGGLFACLLSDLMIKLKIDDPVNCVATHAGSAVWGMIAVALFVEQEKDEGFSHAHGLFKGGGWRLLGVQLLACVLTASWAVVTTVMLLFVIEKTIGIRLTEEEEKEGCDLVEHGIGEDTEDEDVEKSKPQRKRGKALFAVFGRKATNEVEKFHADDEEDQEGKEMKSKGPFVLKMPAVARSIRRKCISNNHHDTGGSTAAIVTGETDTVVDKRCQQTSNGNKQAFWMRLPSIARNLRRKQENKRCSNEEPNATCSSSSTDTYGQEETVETASKPRRATISDGVDGEISQASDDLRSILSTESDIEELVKTEKVQKRYPMFEQKRTEEKCVQVACEHGVLIDM